MLIGRDAEVARLLQASQKTDAQLVAVYGRRRVGKTYLIRETFKGRFLFQYAGIYQGTKREQLSAFYQALLDSGLSPDSPFPQNWMEAFQLLKKLIQASTQQEKILFIDELSWMDSPKSDLMKALEHFWNAWASAQKHLMLIVCSSATSWMLRKVIHNKGGLYNRLTYRLRLNPFSLHQCKEYSQHEKLAFSDTQMMELYMILGGIPYYWNLLEKGLSVAQNVDLLFFSEDAPLKNEYAYLFSSIFRAPKDYLLIIEALSQKRKGLTRNEILEASHLTGSGIFSQRLEELESCGFIREYHAFGKTTKGSLYQLMDPLVLFYHHFLRRKTGDPSFWSHQLNTPAMNTWAGLAFELLCLLHTEQIKKKLGISGILTDVASFSCVANTEAGIRGSQIDLLISRADRTINLLEMKYTNGPYTLSKSDLESLKRKASDFRRETGTRSAIHLTMVTPYGLENNSYAGEIHSQITGDDLFQPI
ncbi:MAG: AAA family ATPase [Clostridia bacterium]|nr:AAA family ATPase [Clostridia bacterium]